MKNAMPHLPFQISFTFFILWMFVIKTNCNDLTLSHSKKQFSRINQKASMLRHNILSSNSLTNILSKRQKMFAKYVNDSYIYNHNKLKIRQPANIRPSLLKLKTNVAKTRTSKYQQYLKIVDVFATPKYGILNNIFKVIPNGLPKCLNSVKCSNETKIFFVAKEIKTKFPHSNGIKERKRNHNSNLKFNVTDNSNINYLSHITQKRQKRQLINMKQSQVTKHHNSETMSVDSLWGSKGVSFNTFDDMSNTSIKNEKINWEISDFDEEGSFLDHSYGFDVKEVNLQTPHFWDASLQLPNEGCLCWDTIDDSHNHEVECTCSGSNFSDVPTNLSTNVHRLTITDAGLERLKNDSFLHYRNTLREIVITNVPNLRSLEPGTFDGLNVLRSVYIHSAPLLTFVPLFNLRRIPKLIILRIVSSELQRIPEVKGPQEHILQMADFENNKIQKVQTHSVNIQVHQLPAFDQYVGLESNVSILLEPSSGMSFKGNARLRFIHPEAFKGIRSLRMLDLSGTSITVLPTMGLETHLEKLHLVDTPSLKAFPSVYSFKAIEEAYLTYPYHCCAFQFPEQHYPEEHQKTIKELEKLNCLESTSTAKSLVRKQRGLQTNSIGYPSTKKSEYLNREEYKTNINGWHQKAPLDIVTKNLGNPLGLMTEKQDGHNQLLQTTTPSFNWHRFHQIPAGHSQRTSHSEEGGFAPVTIHPFENSDSVYTLMPKEHPNWLGPVDVNKTLVVFCGSVSKNYRDVVCRPQPDAFNPCEDIMGNVALRVAVWIVVITAVVGNVVVMVVLMSSRFRISVSKFLMINLSIADLSMGIYLLIIASMDVHTIGLYFNYAIDWQNGYGCKVAGFLTVFASELSIFTLTVITIERWYAITYALNLNKRLKLSLAVKVMFIGWTYAITMASLPLAGISSFSKTSICLPMETKDVFAMTYLVSLLVVNGFAFFVISACYISMYCSISKHDAVTTNNDLTVAKRMALLVFTDFACWAPIAFFGLTAVSGHPLIDVPRAKILLVFFYPLNSCANPYLYAILTKQYRRDLFILLARYGFCTRTAMRYKGAYSSVNNTVPQHAISISPPRHRNSSMTQITLCELTRSGKRCSTRSNASALGTKTPEETQELLAKKASPSRSFAQNEYRQINLRLSTVQELSHYTTDSNDDDTEEKLIIENSSSNHKHDFIISNQETEELQIFIQKSTSKFMTNYYSKLPSMSEKDQQYGRGLTETMQRSQSQDFRAHHEVNNLKKKDITKSTSEYISKIYKEESMASTDRNNLSFENKASSHTSFFPSYNETTI